MLVGFRNNIITSSSSSGDNPTVFNYLAFKFFRNVGRPSLGGKSVYDFLLDNRLPSGNTWDSCYVQMSKVEFYSLETSLKKDLSPFKNRLKMFTWGPSTGYFWADPDVLSIPLKDGGEEFSNIFDNSTSTKVFQPSCGFLHSKESVYFADDLGSFSSATYSWNATNPEHGRFDKKSIRALYGFNTDTWVEGIQHYIPWGVVMDISESPLDISVYNAWSIYNGGDNNTNRRREISAAQVMGSVDGNEWYKLDDFDESIGDLPTTNYGLAYSHKLNPTKAQLCDGMDLRYWYY